MSFLETSLTTGHRFQTLSLGNNLISAFLGLTRITKKNWSSCCMLLWRGKNENIIWKIYYLFDENWQTKCSMSKSILMSYEKTCRFFLKEKSIHLPKIQIHGNLFKLKSSLQINLVKTIQSVKSASPKIQVKYPNI